MKERRRERTRPASGGVRRRKERRARPAIDSLPGRAVLFAAALED